MTPSHFHSVGLIAKPQAAGIAEHLTTLTRHLLEQGIKVVADRSVAEHLGDLPLCAREAFRDQVDLVIVMGGDGTLLGAARSLAGQGTPLVGVNLGRLGFLADISPEQMCGEIDQILRGSYQRDARRLLRAELFRGNQRLHRAVALNDVVVHARDVVRMIELD